MKDISIVLSVADSIPKGEFHYCGPGTRSRTVGRRRRAEVNSIIVDLERFFAYNT